MWFSIFLWVLVGILSFVISWQDFTSRHISFLLSIVMGIILIVLSFPGRVLFTFWWIERLGGSLL
ncbi:MAG: hypothetical protein ACK4HQ_04515, partial [Brevinematales bacterium]